MNHKFAIVIFVAIIIVMIASTVYGFIYYQQKDSLNPQKDEVLYR